MSTDRARLLGMWRLQSFYLEDSRTRERHRPYGDHPPGFLTLHEDGRMLAIITPAGRKAPVTEQDQAAAFGLMVAYSGRWRLEAPDQWFTTVDAAWFEPWVGTDQRRTYRFDGDDRLDVTSAPAVLPAYGEAPVVGVLRWVRD